jgi:hypothetical protein
VVCKYPGNQKEPKMNQHPHYVLAQPNPQEGLDKLQEILKSLNKPTPSVGVAPKLLEDAAQALRDRAVTRDAEGGERSMARTVAIFNAMTGQNLTELEGWRFMISLKLARGMQGQAHLDDYVDLAGYAALAGECATGLQPGA